MQMKILKLQLECKIPDNFTCQSHGFCKNHLHLYPLSFPSVHHDPCGDLCGGGPYHGPFPSHHHALGPAPCLCFSPYLCPCPCFSPNLYPYFSPFPSPFPFFSHGLSLSPAPYLCFWKILCRNHEIHAAKRQSKVNRATSSSLTGNDACESKVKSNHSSNNILHTQHTQDKKKHFTKQPPKNNHNHT